MGDLSRRAFLGATATAAAAIVGTAAFPSIERAAAIPARRRFGDLRDLEHVVVLMMENRSFDHYFGTLPGVRGFGDRFPVPLATGRPVWFEADDSGEVTPFHLDTATTSAMRVAGTPHSWPDAHAAWDEGRFGRWVEHKTFRSMGHYEQSDIPFQRALADAFTLCDHHHCALQTGTLANRVVFMSGTNVTPGRTTPATDQSQALIDNANNQGARYGRYSWTTYPERLERAGVSWRIYQDADDNWGGLLAPWESFAQFHDATPGTPLHDKVVGATLDDLRADVLADRLPSVSWLVPSRGWSEHPSASSPLQGAGYTQRVLDALTANPDVWSRTALIVTFDENDGFFDHVPPPAVPSLDAAGRALGDTTLDVPLGGEYYRETVDGREVTRPYGMGPRVPLYVVSPFSRGGWVCSETFDHTSTIRLLERRFGVAEPNISAWRRTVAGDLTSAFDFRSPNRTVPTLPDMSAATEDTLVIAKPPVSRPTGTAEPEQPAGLRRSRDLPYALDAAAVVRGAEVRVGFSNSGRAGAVVHAYDRTRPSDVPRRYTVGARDRLAATWTSGDGYDLWMLGPAGWHRRFAGRGAGDPDVVLRTSADGRCELTVVNRAPYDLEVDVRHPTYAGARDERLRVRSGRSAEHRFSARRGLHWYDVVVRVSGDDVFLRRFAGRVEGRDVAVSDPAVGS